MWSNPRKNMVPQQLPQRSFEDDHDFVDGRSFEFLAVSEVGKDDYGLLATVNKKEIQDLSSTVAKTLRAIGDAIEKESTTQKVERSDKKGLLERSARCLNSLVQTIDIVLTWLEHCTQKCSPSDLRKQEGVLRGLAETLDFGRDLGTMTIVQIAGRFLDVPYIQLQVEKDYIQKCLKNIEKHQDKILEKVDTVGNILKKMIEEKCFSTELALNFDNTVREAWLEIKECERSLLGANGAIEKLLGKLNTIKWATRSVWLTGIAATCGYLYKRFQNDDITWKVAMGASGLAAIAWIKIMPQKAFEIQEALRSLQYENKDLAQKLDNLKDKLESHKDYKDNLGQ